MSAMPFTFGKADFSYFTRNKQAQILKVLIWYKSASGENRYCDINVPNNAAEDRHEALTDALQYATEFVKERWFLIEVTTPLVLSYGEMLGGNRVLRALRAVEPIPCDHNKKVDAESAPTAAISQH